MEPVAIRPDQLSIWHGPSLFILDASGAAAESDTVGGFYFRETRFLRRLRLEVNGVRPWVCALGRSGAREALIGMTYPELLTWGGGGSGVAGDGIPLDELGVPWRAVDLMLRYRLRYHRLEAGLTAVNRSPAAISVDVSWEVSADWADLLREPVEAAPSDPRIEPLLDRRGLVLAPVNSRLPFQTVVEVDGPGDWTIDGSRLGARIVLEPREPARFELRATPRDDEPEPEEPELDRREERAARWRGRLARARAPGDQLPVRMINQAMDDLGSLQLLEGQPDEWLAPAAGMPLYPALFGRDAITTSWQASMLDRGEQLDSVLTRLGRLQGRAVDPAHDEEPGRIVHSVRKGPGARAGENPFGGYYGDHASPFMFVIGLAQLYAWTGRRETLERHWDTAARILDWARDFGDRDGDGYIEYLTRAPEGPKNQGWKDSGDGIVDEHGGVVHPPIAACEVQGYWFAAQQLMAALSAARGRVGEARALWRASRELKTRFNRDWWMPDERFIGLALDRDKRLVRTITSNPGHCLASGIVADQHVPALVGRLFLPDLWSGWGVRTLSSAHPSYNPIGYHLGSVWTVENATIALGLRRYGFDARARDVATAVFDLAAAYGGHRAPEAVGGYARTEWPHPGAYPRANPLQAWNQSGLVLLLQVLLGLEPVAPLDLLVVDPVLPGWLPEITIENLRVGGATATIRFWRDPEFRSHAEIIRKRGTLRLVRQQPPESLTASAGGRLSALVHGLVHA